MTQEDKNLLLIDLCARLPYEIILLSPNEKITYQTDGNTAAELLVEEGWKPYLRPMSSMTDEEKKELLQISNFDSDIDEIYDSFIHFIERNLIDIADIANFIDWLNEHHFDYRGLIKKGLAIKVTEENNPYKI